jgi:two-component system nitrate/nitrite response regulator NarL
MSHNFCLISQNDIYLEGLACVLKYEGFSVVGCFSSVEDIPLDTFESDYIITLDIADYVQQTLAVEKIKSAIPSAPVIVLAESFDIDALLTCFELGVQGYIIKTMRALPLIAALRLAALGEKVYPSDLLNALDLTRKDSAPPADTDHDIEDANLSPRELDVLCCLMTGFSNKAIARQLDVCEATIKVHVKAILRKLKVRNRTQAAIWASSRGMTDAALATC